MDRKKLLTEMTQYDFGWAGFNRAENNKHLNIAIPNKVFEYIGTGLPVLAFPHKAIQSLIENHEVGLIIDDVSDLPELLHTEDLAYITHNTLKHRHHFTIENQMSKLTSFYEQIINE
jgi:hypothetical protein